MNSDWDDSMVRGIALALAEIASGNDIKATLRACGIYSVDDLRGAGVEDFDIDRLVEFFD